MKNILVPTDFSDCANSAAEYAISLAQMAMAEIHFLHLQATPLDWVKLPLENEKDYPATLSAIGHAKSKLSQWIRKAEQRGLKAEQFLRFDATTENVFRHIKDHHHDFVVMGSHGAKGFKENVIGTNAQQILRNANVPVLIIKQPIFHAIKNIGFVSDFTDVSRGSFHTITDFADLVHAHIDLLFVNTPHQFTEIAEITKNMDRIMTHCNRKDTCTRKIINAGTMEDGVKDFILNNPVDLIAICTHGRSGLVQLFSTSIAEKIANPTLIPVLSIKL